MSDKKQAFRRCVVVVNQTSTNYARGQREIKQLAALFPAKDFEVIEIGSNDYTRPSWLITRLNAAIDTDAKTVLAVAGGDGTVNLIIDVILRSSAVSAAARQAVILPLWAGNANDLANMANGGIPASLESVIKNGAAVSIYPLSVTIRHGTKSTTKLAVCYLSLGASAYASARISKPSHRSKRFYRVRGARLLTDMASVTRAFIGAPTFESSIDGNRRRIYDLVIINGSRMAKINRSLVKLTDKNFYEILVARKHPLIVSYFSQILRGLSVERRTRTERRLTLNETTWAQIDGEALQIPGDTDVIIKYYDQPFYLLSTKLPTDNS
jgi:diacylglycerol kinase family enzyme